MDRDNDYENIPRYENLFLRSCNDLIIPWKLYRFVFVKVFESLEDKIPQIFTIRENDVNDSK